MSRSASSEVFGDTKGAAADESTPFSLAKSLCGSQGDGCLGGGDIGRLMVCLLVRGSYSIVIRRCDGRDL